MCDTFELKSITSQLLLSKKLLLLRFNRSIDSLASHFLVFDKLIRDLKATGGTVQETDIVCHILLTMPQDCENVATAIETLSPNDLKINFVKNRLLDQETKRVDFNKRKKFDSEKFNAFNVQSNESGNGKFGNK